MFLYSDLIKKYIRSFIESSCDFFSGHVVDLGCGSSPYKDLIIKKSGSRINSYLSIDVEESPYHRGTNLDMVWNGQSIPLENDSITCVLMTEVIEHLPEPSIVLAEIRRVLIPGGFLVLTLPFLYPLHEPPSDYARYTPYFIESLASKLGFIIISTRRFGGWNHSFAHFMILWLQSKKHNPALSTAMHILLLPLYLLMLLFDSRKSRFHKFEESMFLGMGVVLRKSLA